MFSKVAQKVNIYLGSFSEKMWHQKLSKTPNLVTLDSCQRFDLTKKKKVLGSCQTVEKFLFRA